MIQWLTWGRKILFRKTNLPALLALLVVVSGWVAAETQARKNHIEAQRATIAAQVALLRADLEGAVNGPIQLVRGLIATIATEPDMDQTRFAELASGLIDSEPLLRNVAAAPDMIIQMMYPIAGNEQAIGLDYNRIPEQRDAAQRARDLGDLVLAGPVDLVQGGQGFIGRFPVYLRNGDSAPVFWGLVSAVVNLEELYAQTGLHDGLPFSVTLTGRDATGAGGQRFFGPEVTPDELPVESIVQLPTGTWQIAALPYGGWQAHPPQIWPTRILLLLAAALILVPSIAMGRSMEARQRAIDELEAANTALHRQMHDLETARAAQAETEVQLRLLETAVARQNDILMITEAEPVKNPDGPKIVYVNDAFERHTGYSRDEVIGKTPRMLQGPKTDRAVLDRVRQALQDWQPVRCELVNYTKSGKEYWIELDIVPLANETGWFTHWVSIERDITDRRRAEAEIRLNQERFQLVTKATNDVVWDWDLIAETQWWSENMLTLFGYDPALLEPGPESWERRLHPDDRHWVIANIDALISGTDTFWTGEYRFRHADGQYRSVIDRSFVMRNDDGEANRMVGSMTDVTEQRELESRLRQSQKLEAVGQLTGGVAHDFNNLLTVILGNAEVLTDALSDRDHLRELAEMTANAAERGAELTSRLLAFSRKQPLQPRVLDVSEQICGGLAHLLRRTLPQTITLHIARAENLWLAEIDPSQLESALLNIVLNARDAMPDGGQITVEIENAVLDDDVVLNDPDLEAGQYVMITVTDTGHGMPEETLARVFEPFFTTKEVGKGSGLGLSMVYGFVKQSGGHVRICSSPGNGTSVTLYFPQSQSEDTQSQIGSIALPVTGGTETILIVEDNEMVREHLHASLIALGYKTVEAENGPQAIEILEQTPDLDLLFTDIILPGGMNGRELADAAQAMRPGLKVLFTSGYSEGAMVQHGRLEPGIELLRKPYRRNQLAEKLRKVLG